MSKAFTSEFWTTMHNLDLSQVWNYLTEERLLQILDTKPIGTLRELNLAYCNRINYSSLEKLGCLPHLTSLDLSYWLQMTSPEWKALMELTQLKTLKLNSVPAAPLEDICTTLTNLRRLECSTLYFFSSHLKGAI